MKKLFLIFPILIFIFCENVKDNITFKEIDICKTKIISWKIDSNVKDSMFLLPDSVEYYK